MNASPSPRRSSSARKILAFRAPTWSSIRWSCRSAALNLAGRAALDLIRRLREELKVNDHLRRIEHLLRPAEPARHELGFPVDGDRGRHDLGDPNPLHAEEMTGVMGADVMMGHDPELPLVDQQAFREPAPEGMEGARAGPKRRRATGAG